ncbi:MAG: siderophore-interacting protein [Acidimicrobiales bacterium]
MLRLRRAPPPFRRAEVAEVRARSPRMQRVAVAGPELVGLDAPDPAASIRLLLPHGGDLVLPEWDGNEFLHADGSRPRLRTLTPLHVDPIAGRLEVDIVLHGAGPMATWALGTRPGDAVAISGTGRGYAIDADAQPLLLAGDESALPAISTILQALPMGADVEVLAEVATADAILELDGPEHLTVTWCEPRAGQAPGEALAAAVEAVALGPGTWVWAAGEAAAVQRIRRHLFETLGLPRRQCTVRGYWKHGRAGAGD